MNFKSSFLHIIKEDVDNNFDDIIYIIIQNKYIHKISIFPLHNISLLYLDDCSIEKNS